MTQVESKFAACCEIDNQITTVRANTIEGLMDEVEFWFQDTFGDDQMIAQQLDNSICIGGFQFLTFRRDL